MRPLEGVKVVEFSMIASAPFCGKTLLEYGADVIKVETPKVDNFRTLGTIYHCPISPEENIVFETINAGKKNICLDLKTKEGMERIHKLIAKADVFISNYRPAALKSMGLDYDSLKEKYPRLIYATVTGYGSEGPDANRPGFDTVSFWAESGFLTDMMIDSEGSYPVYMPFTAGDNVVGTELAGAIAMALYSREKTGKGTSVTTSLFGTALWTFAGLSSATQYGYRWPRGRYEGSPAGTPYKTKDGKWLLTTLDQYNKYWPGFCRAFRAYDMIDDERFNDRARSTNPEYRKEAITRLEKYASMYTAEEICEVLKKEDIVFTILGHMKDNHSNANALLNKNLVPFKYESGKEVTICKPPLHFEGWEPLPHKIVGPVGADNDEVFKEYDL